MIIEKASLVFTFSSEYFSGATIHISAFKESIIADIESLLELYREPEIEQFFKRLISELGS